MQSFARDPVSFTSWVALHCIHLLEGDTQEAYTRVDDGLLEDRGRLFPERFVILTFDKQGVITILDRLGPNNYPGVPVTWESLDPLLTDYSVIFPTASSYQRNFDFYNYVMAQRSKH